MKNKLPDTVRLDQKRSIQAPQSLWLQSPKVKEFVSDLLNSQNFKNRNIFHYNNIKKSYDNFLKSGANNTFHIWQWINTESFFNVFIDKEIKYEARKY